MADPSVSKKWVFYFQEKGMHVVEINSRETGSAKSVNNVVREACKEKIERDKRRGIKNRPIRAMVMTIIPVEKQLKKKFG